MVPIKPLTENQTVAFEQYSLGKNLLLHGAAGTGKTFITLVPCSARGTLTKTHLMIKSIL